ncbi:MAG: hypothetical protein ACYC1D_01155 [Acidimicrobiales bacterium]
MRAQIPRGSAFSDPARHLPDPACQELGVFANFKASAAVTVVVELIPP